MTASVFSRRRAERFAELLDQAAGHGPRHRLQSRLDDDLSSLVALSQQAATLKLAPAAQPDPGFRADLRAMLVATVEREGIHAAVERQSFRATVERQRLRATVDAPASDIDRPRLLPLLGGGGLLPAARGPLLAARRSLAGHLALLSRPLRAGGAGGQVRVAILLSVVLGMLAVSGISAASTHAMPGDTLYGVKRSTERAELAFAGSDHDRGQLYLGFARTRLAEAKAVSASAASFAQVLRDMDADTRQGVKLLTTTAVDRQDPSALDTVDAFVADQQSGAGDVLDRVNGASRARLLGSLDLLEQVAQRAQRLREALTCGITASNGRDALGPRPGSCSPGSDNASRIAHRGQAPGTPAATPDTRGGTAGPGASTATPASHPATSGGKGQPGHGRQTPPPSTAPGDGDGDGGGLIGGLGQILGGLLGG